MNNILSLWNCIVSKAISLQCTSGAHKGLVHNNIINGFYYRETAFAVKIFATQWKITGDDRFLENATLAYEAIENKLNLHNLNIGIDEPCFTPRGVIYRKGSIPATLLLLYSMYEGSKILNKKFIFSYSDIDNYLQSCHISNGRYYHDCISSTCNYYPHITNTSAMALMFYNYLVPDNYTIDCINSKKTYMSIINSQRSDGFWSYIEPNKFQKSIFYFRNCFNSKFISLYNHLYTDKSIFFW